MAILAETSLGEQEPRVLERFVTVLQEELGGDLEDVSLYGSGARGEPPHEESDVDVLVITSDHERHRKRVWRLLDEAAEAEGEDPFRFSVAAMFGERLAQRGTGGGASSSSGCPRTARSSSSS